jgi:hypothetical protein
VKAKFLVMATTASPTEQLPILYIEVDTDKLGRVSLPYSTTATQLRNRLFEHYSISSSMCFVDSKGYPVSTQGEQSIVISDLLQENNVIRLTVKKNIAIPEKKSNVVKEQTELNFASSNIQAMSANLQGAAIIGSESSHSTNRAVMANELDIDKVKRVFDNCNLLCGIRMDGKEPIRAMQPLLKFKESGYCTPTFQVHDSSNIRAYTRNKRMESCFVSNDYFDGSIDFSGPHISIGIDTTYSKTTSKTNEERRIYSTCVFSYPRAIVELNFSYLELTKEFSDAIDNVLQHTPTEDELEKVFLTYGHVYPQRIVLGGHLFYENDHFVKTNVEEKKIRTEIQTTCRTAFSEQTEIHLGHSSAERSRQECSQQDSSITFQAVGGNTFLSRDPTAWRETLADPMFWRVIQQSDYKPVVTLLNKQQQEAINSKSFLVKILLHIFLNRLIT